MNKPHQNGTAEQNLPKYLWTYAAMNTAHV